MRLRGRAAACALALLAWTGAGLAGAQSSSAEVGQLRSELGAMRELVQRMQRQLAEQERTLEQLQAAAGRAPAAGVGAPPPAATPQDAAQRALEEQLARELGSSSAQQGSPTLAQAPALPAPVAQVVDRNYLRLSLDALVAGGTSTSRDLERLQPGGHDPVQRGLTVQNVEMVLDGAVDPYLSGRANLIFQLDAQGETVVELEEAYVNTTSLPHNLQLKAGQFFADFGRLNQQHPHSWDFVDQSLVNARFLGADGLRGPGVRASWLAPTPFYSELFLGMQNSAGETASSFRSSPGQTQFGRPVGEEPVRELTDMVIVPRYAASFDLSETQTLVLGASGAFGPNGSGGGASTRIQGMDMFWRWKPSTAEAGFPFLNWQTESFWRSFEADATQVDSDDDGTPDLSLPATTLRDWGAYSQVVWGLRRGWTAALRGDYVSGTGERGDLDPATRNARWRLSPALTWYPTEFSRLRLQLNRDRIERMGSDTSLWLQLEFLLGAHAAHRF